MSTTETELAEPQGPPAEPGQGEAQEPAAATPETAPQQDNYLLHYRTAEDAEKAIREKDSHIGKLQNELGELRGTVEQIQQTQQQYFSPADDDAFDDLLDEDPERAAREALTRGDTLRLDRAIESWYEVAPRRAAQFERALERQQLEQSWQQRYQPLQQEIGNQQLASAYQSVRSAYPDFDQLEPVMTQAAELAPHLLEPLTSGTVDAKRRVIETLYLMARGMRETGAIPQGAVVPPVQHPQAAPVPYVTQGQTVPPLSAGDQRDAADMAHDRMMESLRRRNELWRNKNS